MVPRVVVPVVPIESLVLVVVVLVEVVRAAVGAVLEAAAPVRLVLLLLEGVVGVAVVEPVVVLEGLDLLGAAAVHVVRALERALAFLAPFLEHLPRHSTVGPAPRVDGRAVPAVRQRAEVARGLGCGERGEGGHGG